MDRLDLAEAFGSLQNIGKVPQRIFYLLRGGIAGFGKGTKCGDVIKVAVVQGTYVHVEFSAGDGVQSSLLHAGGQVQAGSKVIGGTKRDIAHWSAILPLHHAADHLIQGTIAAAADDQIVSAGVLYDLTGTVQTRTGGVNGDLVIVIGKDPDHSVKIGLRLIASGKGIDNK